MNERRRAKRLVITAVAEVTDLENNLVLEGYVANISATGIGVFMKRPMNTQSPPQSPVGAHHDAPLQESRRANTKDQSSTRVEESPQLAGGFFKLNGRVEIKMSFYTMTGIKDVEQIKGKVKRVEQISNVYNIGIQFDGLGPVKDREPIVYLNAAHKTL